MGANSNDHPKEAGWVPSQDDVVCRCEQGPKPPSTARQNYGRMRCEMEKATWRKMCKIGYICLKKRGWKYIYTSIQHIDMYVLCVLHFHKFKEWCEIRSGNREKGRGDRIEPWLLRKRVNGQIWLWSQVNISRSIKIKLGKRSKILKIKWTKM